MKKYIVFFFYAVILTVAPALPAFAKTGSDSADVTDKKPVVRPDISFLKNASSEAKKEYREELRMERETAREKFKANLLVLKDEKKKALTLNFNEKFASMSSRKTEQMEAALGRMQTVLDRAASTAAEAQAAGKDTTLVNSAIADARSAIDVAQAAVASQAAKIYTIPVTTDSEVKKNIGSVMSTIELDLQHVHSLVVDAKQAVMKAVREAHKIKNQSQENL